MFDDSSEVEVAILVGVLGYALLLSGHNVVPLQLLDNSDRSSTPLDGNCDELRSVNSGSMQLAYSRANYFVVLVLDNKRSMWKYFADERC